MKWAGPKIRPTYGGLFRMIKAFRRRRTGLFNAEESSIARMGSVTEGIGWMVILSPNGSIEVT